MFTLKNWAITIFSDNPFLAPECLPRCLTGEVYNHSRFPDGKVIRTSPIISAEGRTVTTQSGSLYQLEEPLQSYLDWLKENQLSHDPENPVRLITGKNGNK